MLTALLALCLAGTPTPGMTAPSPPETPPDLTAFVRQPERVRIYRADFSYNVHGGKRAKKEPRLKVGHFVLSGKGDVVPAEAVQALARTWVPPEKVGPGEHLRCIFNPDIALRFEKGGSHVDVVVCFGCGELIFHDARGETLRDGDFDFSVLRRIAATAFPKEFGAKAPTKSAE
jgi:hypothetical protein